MSISSLLPPISLAQAGAGARALAQLSGQTVEAKVVGQLPNGTTQVLVGKQTLNLQLPAPQTPGTALTLSVQQAEGQLRLTLINALAPAKVGTAASAPAATTASAPATSVQLSPAALSQVTIQPVPGAVAGAPKSVAGATQPLVGTGTPGGGAGAGLVGATGPATVSSVGQAGMPAPAGSPSASAGAAAQQVIATQSGQGAAPPAGTASGAGPQAAAPLVQAGAAAPGAQVRAAMPYAAAVAVAPGIVPTNGGSATTALPPVGQTVSASIVGQHAPPPGQMNAMRPGMAMPPSAPVPTASNSPQLALAQMVQQALPRQDSVVGLTNVLSGLVGRVSLPEPVAKAAQQVLGQRLSLDGGKIDGATIRTAILKSGVFQEALLAGGQGKAASGDLKTALLGLRQSLGNWLGNQSAIEQVGKIAPPVRGQMPRARAGEALPSELPNDPVEVGKLLVERTEAALSRLRLHQNASLPDPNPSRQDAQWSLDLPVTVAGQQQLLQMQIHRDSEGDSGPAEERGWQVRFAINLPGMGEVGAQISMRALSTGVLLWADRPETAVALEADIDALREQLASVGLHPGAIVVRSGAPPQPTIRPTPDTGHLVDATR
jgi:hypothetical protein